MTKIQRHAFLIDIMLLMNRSKCDNQDIFFVSESFEYTGTA